MKKICLFALLLTLSFLSAEARSPTFCQRQKERVSYLKIVNICELTDAELTEVMNGRHPDVAIEFSSQTSLPIHFFLKGELVSLDDEVSGLVKIKQTLYARCQDKQWFLSTNLNEWKPWLQFITGTASVALSIQEGEPSLLVGAETNKRA